MCVIRPRIGIIGDFKPDYLYHRATNLALESAASKLSLEVAYAWIPTALIGEKGAGAVEEFDALWASPGSPYESLEGALLGIQFARQSGRPFVAT
jgi:CTP synthase (UTP-ammonia lyase)